MTVPTDKMTTSPGHLKEMLEDMMDHMERGSISNNTFYTDEQFRNVLTNTMSISPELFERFYLQPKPEVKGDLRKRLANPTPVAILGFAIALFPLSIALMGWRGSGLLGTPTNTSGIWFGGFLLIVGGIGEFVLGNTFSFVVFFAYGAHFLTYATAFLPAYTARGFTPDEDPYKISHTFDATFAFYALSMAILSFVFLICSIRTNMILVSIFVCATVGFALAAAGDWFTAGGDPDTGEDLLIGAGAWFFITDLHFWYLLLSMLIPIMELPLPDLPVFDLSKIVQARPRESPA